MPRKTIDFDTVSDIGLALPGTEEGTVYGSPCLKVGGKMFACIPVNRDADPESLLLMVGFDEQSALMEEEPGIYYAPPHYANSPAVLVRLARINRDVLRDLLLMAHRHVSLSATRTKRRPRGR